MKRIPVKIELNHEAPAFVPSVALNLPSQISAVLSSDTVIGSYNNPRSRKGTGIQQLSLSVEFPAEHQ